jgi:magnesium chelatase family protein
LRTALEDGEIRLSRRAVDIARYPARFQLVLASRPCACGRSDPDCSCSPHARRRYLARLSGPLLDRVDLRVRLRPEAAMFDTPVPDSTTVVRPRVQEARHRAMRRWAEHGRHTNADVAAAALRQRSRPAAVLRRWSPVWPPVR